MVRGCCIKTRSTDEDRDNQGKPINPTQYELYVWHEMIWQDIRRLASDVLRVLVEAVRRFTAARSSEAAAGMAYYGLFSLFPLLLVLVSIGGFVLESEDVYQEAIGLLGETVPISTDLIEKNIQHVLDARGSVGLVGLLGTLWSATGFFNALTRNVNHAWRGAEKRDLFERRLVALGMVGILVLLLFLSVTSTAVVGVLPRLPYDMWNNGSIIATSFWTTISRATPWLFKLLFFMALFRWVPNTEVPWRAAMISALVTAVGWEAITEGFVAYLSSGLARYKLIYGSLGTVVALMVWIYLSCWITLFGAHLNATIAQHIGKD